VIPALAVEEFEDVAPSARVDGECEAGKSSPGLEPRGRSNLKG
jgi:hypothetical protein